MATINIHINGELLPVKTEVKNLGLWMDTDLRFTKHVNQLCQSSYNTLRQLFPHREIRIVGIAVLFSSSCRIVTVSIRLEDLRKIHSLNLSHRILINKKLQYLHTKNVKVRIST